MNINYMKEFLVMTKTLNFSTAANLLYISQSTLSRHIAALEENLGTQLFNRSTTTVTLTESGLLAKASFESILEEYHVLYQKIEEKSKVINASLRLGFLNYAIDELITPTLHIFKKNFPNIQIQYNSYCPPELITNILNDRIDVGPVIKSDYSELKSLRFFPIIKDRFIVMLPESHKLSTKSTLSLQDLEDECFIFLKNDPASNYMAHQKMAKCGFVPKYTAMADQFEFVRYTLHDIGGVHITGNLLNKLDSWGIRKIPLSDEKMEYEISFAYKYTNQNPAIPLFLNHINMVPPII